MMKLSLMKKVVDTVDSEWRSPLADHIAVRWGFDKGSVKYFRGSANFLFFFRKDGNPYFLRFNHSSERTIEALESELSILDHLDKADIKIAKPVLSQHNRFIETVDTDLGMFHAICFEAVSGDHPEIDDLSEEDFYSWGSSLGALHKVMKTIPESLRMERPSWVNHLEFVHATLSVQDVFARKELESVKQWAEGIEFSSEQVGLIHYDYELDNLCWDTNGITAIDFDDCAQYWYAADITFALRDLETDGDMVNNPSYQQFIAGYSSETDVDTSLLKEMYWFQRLHRLVMYAKLIRSLDQPIQDDDAEWLNRLRSRLESKVEQLRNDFKKQSEK